MAPRVQIVPMLLRREMEDSKVDADERSRGVAQDAEELSMMEKSNSRCLVYNTEIEREGGKREGRTRHLGSKFSTTPSCYSSLLLC